MGEQHANGWRVSRHRTVADVTVGVIANPMSGRDIWRLVASASVFPNAEKGLLGQTIRIGRRQLSQSREPSGGGPGEAGCEAARLMTSNDDAAAALVPSARCPGSAGDDWLFWIRGRRCHHHALC